MYMFYSLLAVTLVPFFLNAPPADNNFAIEGLLGEPPSRQTPYKDINVIDHAEKLVIGNQTINLKTTRDKQRAIIDAIQTDKSVSNNEVYIVSGEKKYSIILNGGSLETQERNEDEISCLDFQASLLPK